jgi:hypothetical protein
MYAIPSFIAGSAPDWSFAAMPVVSIDPFDR